MFSPEDFVARLAALVHRLRANLTRYPGVFATNCKLRAVAVPNASNAAGSQATHHRPGRSDPATTAATPDTDRVAPLTWAQRFKRVFLIDITVCPHCGDCVSALRRHPMRDRRRTRPGADDRVLAHVRKRATDATASARMTTPTKPAQRLLNPAHTPLRRECVL